MVKKSTLPVPAEKGQEFRKANSIVATRVARGGTLTLLARKLFNTLLYHTQQQRLPGQGAPTESEEHRTLYWLPVKEIAKDAKYGSRDQATLIETLNKLQDIRIVSETVDEYGSDVLIAVIRVVNRGKAGALLGWGLHPATEKILCSPDFYTRLSLYYLTSLSTTGGSGLYEIAKRYATSPGGLTRREPWHWWFELLTGVPITTEKPEYRYFKRDVLKPAIREVNTTDIQVELIEYKDGRYVSDLQFQVSLRQQQALELPAPPIIDTQLLDRMEALGLRRREAEDIAASTESKKLSDTLEFTEGRVASTTLPLVASPAAFFRSALRNDYADSAGKAKASRTKALTVKAQLADEAKAQLDAEEATKAALAAAAAKAALARFESLPEQEQKTLLAQFKSESRSVFKTGSIAHKKAFCAYLLRLAEPR